MAVFFASFAADVEPSVDLGLLCCYHYATRSKRVETTIENIYRYENLNLSHSTLWSLHIDQISCFHRVSGYMAIASAATLAAIAAASRHNTVNCVNYRSGND